MKVEIEKIGPERAQELLGGTINRNKSGSHARSLARDMETGNWRPNSILQIALVDGRQVMIDGQHRMMAVVLSGTTQEFVVISGLALEDQRVIDTGRKRSLRDTLTRLNETNVPVLAAAVSWLWRRQLKMWNGHQTPTIAEGLRLLAEHPQLRDSITPTWAPSRQFRISHGMACCLHYEMTLIDSVSAADFWERLLKGADLGERHPIYALRQRLEKNLVNNVSKLDETMLCALVIKTWNAYLRGDEISFIRWTRGGANPEPFPVLLTLQDVE